MRAGTENVLNIVSKLNYMLYVQCLYIDLSIG